MESPDPEAGCGPSWEAVRGSESKDCDSVFRQSSDGMRPDLDLGEGANIGEAMRSTRSKSWDVNFRRSSVSTGPRCVSFSSDSSKDCGLTFKDTPPEDLRSEQSPSEDPQTKLQSNGRLKGLLQQRFSQVFEGVTREGDSAPLQRIYTELHVTAGGASEVNQEHEVISIENFAMKPAEETIACEDIFKGGRAGAPIRTALTKGVAGIGKTVLTQKFALDWAEGRANQDVQLLFPFTFRELNVLRGREFSLVGLLHHCFSQTKDLCSLEDLGKMTDNLQVLFIFDGLDECRLPLDFTKTKAVTDPTESASVEELLVNLIRGDLLPSARLWITTRPAAANQIPAWCVSMVTEVRGFTDKQKDQYFMKRFRDERQATAVISHIKKSRSLYIMCHLPIFCWIFSSVLESIMGEEPPTLPKTLTNLYIHFLVVQLRQKMLKYSREPETDLHWTPETREMVRSLGKLAFEQLQKGNLIFYESDLRECGLDAAEIARYSGVFTQIFREEPGLYQGKVYCFIHLSVQEFLAALHVHQTFFSSGENLLSRKRRSEKGEASFYVSAVDQALLSPNGHLDLFLRFLLGLSLPTNQRLLQGLLTQTGNDRTNQETAEYIKKKLNGSLSAERSMNLFHCLHELNDRSLVQQVQSFMKKGWLCELPLSGADWSAVAFLLLSSDSELEEFDLRRYGCSERALLQLLPVVKASTTSTLSGCNLSPLSCAPLASVLSSSSLTHLDLSNNDLQDSGVEQLCAGLKSAPCSLETLRLSGCLVSERGGASLAAALSSAPSRLRELDLSYNHPGPSARLLTTLQHQPSCLLDSLRLDPAGEQWMVPGLRKYSCDITVDVDSAHRRLLVTEDKRTVTLRERPDPDREDSPPPQVMSSSGLRGRCYWEVQWRGSVDIAASYRRTGGGQERFGDNDWSWSLRINDKGFFSSHGAAESLALSHGSYSEETDEASGETAVASDDVGGASGVVGGVYSGPVGGASGTVGVYLDHEGGALSFYRVSSDGAQFHLDSFSACFSAPLFPAFSLRSPGSSVSLRKLRE